MSTFAYEFNSPSYKGKVSFPTGVFIDGEFSDGSEGSTIESVLRLLVYRFLVDIQPLQRDQPE